jgi:HEAT repeat protein
MCQHKVLLIVGILLGAWPIRSAADEPSKSEQKIRSLVNQLGSKRFQEREEAARQLSLLGKTALPALQDAAKSTDAEVRRRAQQLMERLDPPEMVPMDPPLQPVLILEALT